MIRWLTVAAPERITIDLTNQCNLRCRYCCFFQNETEVSGGDLPEADWIDFIKEAGRAGVMRIALRGGEVLTCPGFRNIVDTIVANRMRFTLQTNGGLLTDDLAAYIAGTGRCDVVRISMDGTEAIHDAQRGKGSFAAALRALRLLEKHRVTVVCVMTVHKENLPLFEECADYLLKEIKVPKLSFSLATAASGTPGHLALDADDFYNWVMRCDKLEKIYGKGVFTRGGAAPVLNYWRGLHARLGKKAERIMYGHCSAVHHSLSVRHDGGFVPCLKMSDDVLGFVGKDSLLDVWQKSGKLQELRKFSDTPCYREKCADCPYREWCTAGCPANPDLIEECGIGCLKEFLARGGQL